jgi:lysophospholipase L1-like esterase
MLKVYLFIIIGWIALTAFGFWVRRPNLRRYILRTSYVLLLVFCVEFACVMFFYVKNRRWTFNDERAYLSELFEPHPYLVAVPRKNAHVAYRDFTYTHNSQGFRGPEIAPKSDRLRIVAIGGSTTYGGSVTDGKEWAAQLRGLLGDRFEILNFGMLGHSTAEHIALLSLIVPEYQPDLLIIHAGINDLRNMHIRNLAPDYSNYHAPALYASFNLCTNSPVQKFASGKVAIFLLQKAHVYPKCSFSQPFPEEDKSPEAENRALNLYRRNLETLVTIARGQGLKPILVPQVLIEETLLGNRLRWWIPYIDDVEIVDYLERYNKVTEEVAAKHGVYFAREVLEPKWTKEDFGDASHLNASGSSKFAQIMRDLIANLKEEQYRVQEKNEPAPETQTQTRLSSASAP